jgi:transglutaminase-like putative cysteine protease
MLRHVSSTIGGDLAVDAASARLVLSVAAATPGVTIEEESLSITLDGQDLGHREIDDHGSRLHLVDPGGAGPLEVRYTATVRGRAAPAPVDDLDLVRYLRPSRYCESDQLVAIARSEFRGLVGRDLVDAVSSWVGTRVSYVSGSSRPTDGAVATLLAGQGVCRDYAHLVVALLRACDLPARMVSVYAPGLQPMDFHAVAEAAVDGEWLALDATCLAPRRSMLRIATGRDAADTAFLTTIGCTIDLQVLEVVATTEDTLPQDDLTLAAHLG